LKWTRSQREFISFFDLCENVCLSIYSLVNLVLSISIPIQNRYFSIVISELFPIRCDESKLSYSLESVRVFRSRLEIAWLADVVNFDDLSL
jgi:hypothetical protein